MGLLFNKIIPMEMLAQMPLPFVHRLRDIRINQLKQEAERSELQRQGISAPISAGRNPNNFAVPSTAIDDLVDELS